MPPSPPQAPRWAWTLTGVVAAAVGLGVAQLAAVVTGADSAPVVAVGGAVVDATPLWLKNAAIRWFGTSDKAVLLLGIVVVLCGLAAAVGLLARSRLRAALYAVAALGAIAALAAVRRPDATWLSVLPSVLGALVSAWGLRFLVERRTTRSPAVRPATGPAASPTDGQWDRRAFLLGSAGLGAAALVAGGSARLLAGGSNAAASRAEVRLPLPATPVPPLPPGVDLHLPGLTPFTTPVNDFYRVDTALVVPRVVAADWRLRVHGMVDREIELTYADLLARPLVETDLTLCCVSNEVGGPYVGNARWLGARLKDLLDEAGVHPGADQLLSRSADGWTCGTPTAAVMDGRAALLAVGMDGLPLPIEHGFPVRMVVPGLYGYVSATKWVVDLELTTFAAATAYWVSRGWAARGPVKTMTRIDTPGAGTQLRAGAVAVAGVAWAQHRGIDAVEVRVDGGPWQPARLAAVPGIDTWRQWVYRWDATPGSHTLWARAVDGTGDVQTGQQSPPEPDGASGWPTVAVTVR
ncbi:MAG TPA: molybdopterin-dependent oxidoreductase [Actinomycetes bacterium]